MRRFFSQHSLHLFEMVLDEWSYARHTHNFYELILIKKGKGKHCLNDVKFNYNSGDIFLLTPNDNHIFEIEETTTFTYIQFTEQIFIEKKQGYHFPWIDKLLDQLYRPNVIPESIIKCCKDKDSIFKLTELLVNEFRRDKINTRILILELFGAIMLIVARNLARKNVKGIDHRILQTERHKIDEVLSYIRKNIREKELLSQKNIAEKFNLSPNYVSIYLKKHTGMNLQMMVTQTRVQTVERLLKQSSLNISEISEKLGFNDSSHLNKTFKKYRGMNPMAFRKGIQINTE